MSSITSEALDTFDVQLLLQICHPLASMSQGPDVKERMSRNLDPVERTRPPPLRVKTLGTQIKTDTPMLLHPLPHLYQTPSSI